MKCDVCVHEAKGAIVAKKRSICLDDKHSLTYAVGRTNDYFPTRSQDTLKVVYASTCRISDNFYNLVYGDGPLFFSIVS